jgi:hypothetical protein
MTGKWRFPSRRSMKRGLSPRRGRPAMEMVVLQEGKVHWMVVSLQPVVFGQQGSAFSAERCPNRIMWNMWSCRVKACRNGGRD